MIGFAALHWPKDDAGASRLAENSRTTLLERNWRIVVDMPGWSVLVEVRPGRITTQLFDHGRTVVIGRIFDRHATERGRVAVAALPTTGQTFGDLCRHLTRHCWGAYVAMQCDVDATDRLDLFRDPIGMLDCCTWVCGSLCIATSQPETLLPHAPPADLAIDWPRVAQLIRRPGTAGDALPIIGVGATEPGVHVQVGEGDDKRVRHWSPERVARRPMQDDHRAGVFIPRMINATIAAWTSCSEVAIAELSGGLDSAIVAEGIASTVPNPVVGWYHYFATDPEGDERLYVRAVAEQLQLFHQEILRDHRAIDQALMDQIPLGLRPNVASISLFHDQDLAAQGRALGADCLLTGQGGDALFFQQPSPLLAAELWRDPRPWRDRRRMLEDLAAWTGKSVWSLAGSMIRTRFRPVPVALPAFPFDLVNDAYDREPDPIPWLENTADLAPAKQLQILTLSSARAAFAGSWSADVMAVVHPLMSQPLVDHILPIPALDLTRGQRDRALVRDVYAHRLPATLIERRGKGCLTPFYGRMLAASVPFLRSYLLGGVLAGQGLLNLDRLAAVLDSDVLMRADVYMEIFVVLLMERWARGWTDQIATIQAA